jgi:CRISPR system Cascade subunit CasA
MNLLTEKWIPVVTASDERKLVTPSEITADMGTAQELIAVSAVRPDLTAAMTEFLIGLFQTALPPDSRKEWSVELSEPPSPSAIDQALSDFTQVFNLDGHAERFMQDLTIENRSEREADDNRFASVSTLLLNAPGESEHTTSRHVDFFVKRGLIKQMCLPCAAQALYTHQAFCGPGGVGYQSSLRGGGHVSTLVIGQNLWQTIWYNVLPSNEFLSLGNKSCTQLAEKFPWMARTVISNFGATVTAEHVHPLALYWAMPRRVRLIIEEVPVPVVCDLCGETSTRVARSINRKNRGADYRGPWRHPLSPTIEVIAKAKPTDENDDISASDPHEPVDQTSPRVTSRVLMWQLDGLIYQDWVGLLYGHKSALGREIPAPAVQNLIAFASSSGMTLDHPRLWAFGYKRAQGMEMDAWYEATVPVVLADPFMLPTFIRTVSGFIETAKVVGFSTLIAVKTALSRTTVTKTLDGVKIFRSRKGKDFKTLTTITQSQFWHETEQDFFSAVAEVYDLLHAGEKIDATAEKWLARLKQEGLSRYRQTVENVMTGHDDMLHVLTARRDLGRILNSQKYRDMLSLPKRPKKVVEPEAKGAE